VQHDELVFARAKAEGAISGWQFRQPDIFGPEELRPFTFGDGEMYWAELGFVRKELWGRWGECHKYESPYPNVWADSTESLWFVVMPNGAADNYVARLKRVWLCGWNCFDGWRPTG
jgi:hypothetical protein